MWLPGPGETKILTLTGTLPTSLPIGTYALYLNLPDPAVKLKGRPEYSIRLANQNIWEATTGFNSMLHEVMVLKGNASNLAPKARKQRLPLARGLFQMGPMEPPATDFRAIDGKVRKPR